MNERSVVVRLRAEVADFKRQMAEATRSVAGVGKQSQETAATASTAMGRMAQSASQHRQQWDLAGKTLLGFGTITVAALGASAMAAVNWETAWTGVLKTVDGTPAQLDAVETGLRGLATTLPATHDEIAAVAEAAGQLGVKTKDILGFTKVMIDLGETTNLSADEAATAIAQLMNVMGTAPQNVGRLGAALVALGNDGASTERDIILMAQRISSAGKLVGLTEGDVLGLANAVSSMGIEVEAGGSAVSRVLTDIAKAVSQGGADLDTWARVAGTTADNFAAKWRADPADALLSFTEGLGRMHAAGEDVFTTLDELGQSDIRTSRALLSMASATDLARESIELGNDAWRDNTALLAEAEKRYDTTAAKVAIARNSINDAAISLGDTFLPVLASAAEQLAGFAQWFADLPEPVQRTIAGLTGVAGVAALVAGGFLMVFPRVIETIQAFKTLRDINPGVASGLGKVGKAAGAVGAALAAAAVAGALFGKKSDTTPIEEYTAALLDLEAAARQGEDVPYVIEDMADAFRRVSDPNAYQQFNHWAEGITSLVGVKGDVTLLTEEFNRLGEGLETIYASDPELAAAKFQEVLDETGATTDELLALMPAYAQALEATKNETTIAAESTDSLVESYNALTGATEELTEEQAKWRAEVAEVDAAFIDGLGAYQAIIQGNQDAAQAVADGTESSTDSWTDYIDAFGFTVDEYLAELQRQVDAQLAWETNMLLLSGRVSQGVIDELWAMGVEGAPLVAALVDASDEELQRMELLFGQHAAGATGQFATTLDTAAPIIAAAAAQLGQGAAAEIAAKLAAGTATVEQIMWDYGLVIEGMNPSIKVDTTYSYEQMSRFVAAYTNYVIPMGVRITSIDTRAILPDLNGVVSGSGRMGTYAGGGPVVGAGTETSDSIPARLSLNEHVWSAAEVRGAGGHAAVAELRAAARSDGLTPMQVTRFADGGSPAWSGGVSPAARGGRDGARIAVTVQANEPLARAYAQQVADLTTTRLRDALAVEGLDLAGVLS